MCKVLLGFKRSTAPVPWGLFNRILRSEAKKAPRVLGGLDKDQRGVHRFAVMNLPSLAGPRAPGFVADHLRIAKAQVIQILDELERHPIFLFRPGGRDVVWAYPVTAEPTPHKRTFSRKRSGSVFE